MPEKMLVDSQCKRARAHKKVYTLRDGGGLFMIVHPDGRKYWQFRFSYGGRQKLMQLGPYSELSLDTARGLLKRYRDVLQRGADPAVARKVQRLQQVRETLDSFDQIAYEWLEHFKSDWSAVHYERNEGLIRRILLPKLGPLPIREVDITTLLSVLRAAEASGILMSARRARTIASQVFDYALSTGRASANPARDLLGAMRPRPQTKHHAALQLEQVGPMLTALAESNVQPATAAALKLMLYTGLRDFSLRAAKWEEINFTAKSWTIPSSRMKGRLGKRQPHTVPLPRQAISILRALAPFTDRGPESFIFPGAGKAGYLSENTLAKALRALGFDVTAHGLRSLITDALYEAQFHDRAIERQLSHADRSEVRAAYLRSDFFEYRTAMMQWWANLCDALRDGKPAPKPKAGNVVRLLRSEV